MKKIHTVLLMGLFFHGTFSSYSQNNFSGIIYGGLPSDQSDISFHMASLHSTHGLSSYKEQFAFTPYNPISLIDSPPTPGKDTLPLPHKNYLRNDDAAFNKRYPVWNPIGEILLTNALIWSYDKVVLKAPYADISSETIKNNFKNGWEWDTDDFPTNFSLHPYTGSLYYNTARSNGYNFYQSAPFVLGGSLMWELFMENTKPSYNDLVNTTVSGIFLGEVLYRLSSSILDDRKTGGARVLREVLGTIIDPERGFNRLLQGKMTRVVDKEIYQKEPLFLSIEGGARQPNDGTNIAKGLVSPMLNLTFTYGDPYENRYRKPFDYFRLRSDFSFADVKSIVNKVIGDAFLFGGNTDTSKKMQTLIGGFLHYDYWNTDSFEIGTIALGAGILSKLPVFTRGNFQNQLHLAIVPLGGSNAQKIVTPDTINYNYKNYTYSGGAQMKFESSLNFGWGELSAAYYLYWLHTYVGKTGDNLINILRPRVTIKIFKAMSFGLEYLLYDRRDSYKSRPSLHVTTGEQRVFLLFNFENF